MLEQNDRALKEWAAACEAIGDGRQILLIRKGGIREEGGIFTISDREFFLMPTFEHQNPALVRLDVRSGLDLRNTAPDPANVHIDTYAAVDTILTADDERLVNAVAADTIWSSEYVKLRFDFNPYDPLYLLLLRAYRLPERVALPLLPEYVGCRSWVTLDRSLSTHGSVPAMSDADFNARKERLLATLRAEL